MSEMALRVGMFGGTFDPVHLGHLRSAVEVSECLKLDKLHMIPAPRPPLRGHPQVSARDRLALLEAGIKDTPGLIADGRELRRQGPSYSTLTLAELREEYGQAARLVMLLGQDAFLRLADWHQPEQLFALAHVVVVARPGYQSDRPAALKELIGEREVDSVSSLMAEPKGKLLAQTLPTSMAISATLIRQRLADHRSVRYLLPETVEKQIHARQLYTF